MSRSLILKEIISGEGNIETSLLQLKVILSSIKNKDIQTWIESELNGYKNVDDIPDYRVVHGVVKGSCTVYNTVQYTNIAFPVRHLDDKIRKNICSHYVGCGVAEILETSKLNKDLIVEIPNNFWSLLEEGMNGNIYESYLYINSLSYKTILTNIRSKIVDILLVLEKEFGNLDDFYIDITQENNNIINQIYNIMYNKSITIGDNNIITKSHLTSV